MSVYPDRIYVNTDLSREELEYLFMQNFSEEFVYVEQVLAAYYIVHTYYIPNVISFKFGVEDRVDLLFNLKLSNVTQWITIQNLGDGDVTDDYRMRFIEIFNRWVLESDMEFAYLATYYAPLIRRKSGLILYGQDFWTLERLALIIAPYTIGYDYHDR
jgi:hypothetical protein